MKKVEKLKAGIYSKKKKKNPKSQICFFKKNKYINNRIAIEKYKKIRRTFKGMALLLNDKKLAN